jgi:hypothetical protein
VTAFFTSSILMKGSSSDASWLPSPLSAKRTRTPSITVNCGQTRVLDGVLTLAPHSTIDLVILMFLLAVVVDRSLDIGLEESAVGAGRCGLGWHGESAGVIVDGHTLPGGKLSINADGGGLSCMHTGR